MRKLFIIGLGLTLSFIGLNAKAQSMDAKFGVKAGGNMTMMGKYEFLGTEYTSKYVPGWQAGFFLELPLSEKLSFMPEVLYSQKGGRVEGSDSGNSGEIKLKAGYIEVPVMLSFNASPAFSIQLGAQASFLTNQTSELYVNDVLTTTVTDKDNFRSSVAGGIVGMGYKISPKVNLNARYNMDFQSFTKDNLNQDKARFNGFALSLGYGF
ncbi:porin family protein [Pedobacter insulae]|uniref:Outer membrane protein beta-barrel domain-containing protein n=1 Tax=Pedobacter insulae TaxID=414048 RepID=A0A1I2T0J3_9SPHI|nr:porin family protein [Pedobacter insulae]SFG55956.1 Outer membrane protein beta-barrel domain-containing protein [Pedobacter insulae]